MEKSQTNVARLLFLSHCPLSYIVWQRWHRKTFNIALFFTCGRFEEHKQARISFFEKIVWSAFLLVLYYWLYKWCDCWLEYYTAAALSSLHPFFTQESINDGFNYFHHFLAETKVPYVMLRHTPWAIHCWIGHVFFPPRPLFMLWKLRHICMCGRSVEGPGDQARLPNNVSSHEFHSPAPYFNSHLFQPHKRVEFHSYFPTYMMSSCNRNLNIWKVFQCPLFVRDVFESRLFSTHTMYPWQFWIEVIRTHPYFSWSVWSKWGVRSLPVKTFSSRRST